MIYRIKHVPKRGWRVYAGNTLLCSAKTKKDAENKCFAHAHRYRVKYFQIKKY